MSEKKLRPNDSENAGSEEKVDRRQALKKFLGFSAAAAGLGVAAATGIRKAGEYLAGSDADSDKIERKSKQELPITHENLEKQVKDIEAQMIIFKDSIEQRIKDVNEKGFSGNDSIDELKDKLTELYRLRDDFNKEYGRALEGLEKLRNDIPKKLEGLQNEANISSEESEKIQVWEPEFWKIRANANSYMERLNIGKIEFDTAAEANIGTIKRILDKYEAEQQKNRYKNPRDIA